DLVQAASAHARRVDDEVSVHDRVDLCGADDACDDRVRGVGAHELGAFELDARFVRVETDDDFDVGPAFERLRDAPAPVGGEPGDENTHRNYPNQTERRVRNMSYRASCTIRRMRSVSSMTRLREYRSWLAGTSKDTGWSTRILNFAGGGIAQPAGPNTSMFAVIGTYGTFSALASRLLLKRTGIASSAPITASGITGTPARIAISTNPPRPNRRSWYRSP